MDERIIVSFTTWKPRMKNIPAVLDSIFAQTLPPDLVVLNLDREEVLPEDIREYLAGHNVEINLMDNLKVYKKLIPTLRKYPEACVISIDDDWIYPDGMIADFMETHRKFPDSPISGNKVTIYGLACHCGCASLTKAEYFGKWLDCIDERVMRSCASDDLTYTYFIARNGRKYARTEGTYYENMESLSSEASYTNTMTADLFDSWDYLQARFGHIGEPTLMVYMHINHPYLVPAYLEAIKSICDCTYDLYVTYSEDNAEIEAIRDTHPDAVLRKVEYSEDGMTPFLDAIDCHPGYDYALKLTTWSSHNFPFTNSLNLSGYALTKAMMDVFLSSTAQFRKILKHFRNHPDTDVICGVEGYKVFDSLRGRTFAGCCPVSIFMCRTGKAHNLVESSSDPVRVKLMTGMKNSFFKKFIHYLFTIERNQNGPGKIVTILSFPITIRKK
ncbi:MAG: hypothetical protein MJY55_03315 [Bacteroidales bacterium]|nr:hypothetical protein [Bacteroidales bacterium]